jgi:hypothetical protein
MAAGASIAIAIPLVAAVANAAIHWRRFRPPPLATPVGQRRAAPPQLSLRALIDEGIATLLVFLFPVAAVWPQRRRRGDDDPPPLAVLHEPFPAAASWLLLRRLRGSGWRVSSHIIAARPLAESAVDELAGALIATVDGAAAGGPIALLGLGGCGLLARQLAAREARFARVLTLATPHQGTTSAAAPASLRPQAPYIEAVARMDRQPRRFDAVAVYSDGDAWLEPPQAAYYPGAFNLEVHDVGHLSMYFSRRVFAYVVENLSAPLPAAMVDERTGAAAARRQSK